MPTQRRYVIRLYDKGQSLAGILEDARNGTENPFNGARELVSLLRTATFPSFASLQPKRGVPNANVFDGKRKPRRRIRKQDKV